MSKYVHLFRLALVVSSIIVIYHLWSMMFYAPCESIEVPRKTEPCEQNIPNGTDILIVGSGLSGAILAHLHATELKHRVLVIEKREHVGGNCYDYIDRLGIRVSRYGQHTFHTNNQKVWDFVSQFTDWLPYRSRLVGFVNDKYVPLPPNIDTISLLAGLNITTTGEMKRWIQRNWITLEDISKGKELEAKHKEMEIYKKLIEPFAENYFTVNKEGGEEMYKSRFAIRDNWETRFYPNETYQGIPRNGYTAIINKLLSHPNITVQLGRTFCKNTTINKRFKKLYYTGKVDDYFSDRGLPKLEYVAAKFEKLELQNTKFIQPAPVVYYLQGPDKLTKVTEYKHFMNLSTDFTTIVKEIPYDGGTPIYPVDNLKNERLSETYRKLASEEEIRSNVRFVGGMATCKYLDMGSTVLNALEIFERLVNKSIKPASKRNPKKTPSLSLIVNHCNESIEWIANDFARECVDREMNVFIYEKCDTLEAGKRLQRTHPYCKVRQIVLPNVGREGHSWIHHLLSQSLHFHDINVFLQGGKEANTSTIMDSFKRYSVSNSLREDYNVDTPLKSLASNLTLLSRYRKCTNAWLTKCPMVKPGFNHWFKEVTHGVQFFNFFGSYRGEMIVSDVLLRRSISRNTKFLMDMYRALSNSNDPLEGHFLERLWVIFFRWPYINRSHCENENVDKQILDNEKCCF